MSPFLETSQNLLAHEPTSTQDVNPKRTRQYDIHAIWIIVFATVYQQIESYVFTPRVSRATMDVHPAIALGSVFVGVGLFGVIGAIIGIPLAA